jgi:hypothetical protein
MEWDLGRGKGRGAGCSLGEMAARVRAQPLGGLGNPRDLLAGDVCSQAAVFGAGQADGGGGAMRVESFETGESLDGVE